MHQRPRSNPTIITKKPNAKDDTISEPRGKVIRPRSVSVAASSISTDSVIKESHSQVASQPSSVSLITKVQKLKNTFSRLSPSKSAKHNRPNTEEVEKEKEKPKVEKEIQDNAIDDPADRSEGQPTDIAKKRKVRNEIVKVPKNQVLHIQPKADISRSSIGSKSNKNSTQNKKEFKENSQQTEPQKLKAPQRPSQMQSKNQVKSPSDHAIQQKKQSPRHQQQQITAASVEKKAEPHAKPDNQEPATAPSKQGKPDHSKQEKGMEVSPPQMEQRENRKQPVKPQLHEERKSLLHSGDKVIPYFPVRSVGEKKKGPMMTGDVGSTESAKESLTKVMKEQWVTIKDLETRLETLATENKDTRRQVRQLRRVNTELQDTLKKTSEKNKQLGLTSQGIRQKEVRKQTVNQGVQVSLGMIPSFDRTCHNCQKNQHHAQQSLQTSNHPTPRRRSSKTYLQLTDGFVPSISDDAVTLEMETQRIVDRVQALTVAMDRHCMANKKLRLKVERVLHNYTKKGDERTLGQPEMDEPE